MKPPPKNRKMLVRLTRMYKKGLYTNLITSGVLLNPDRLKKLESLGPDLLAEDITDQEFVLRMEAKAKWPLCKALMDQSVVAGVGNYIKSDSLWLARVSPLKKVCDITDEELRNLNRSIKHIMRESFQSGGATIKTYKSFDGTEGQYSRRFLVYNQEKDPDGNQVKKQTTDDKRSTFWVPEVQI